MSKDSYEVLAAIGKGSFGVVSKIKRKSDGVVLVWKEINFGKFSEKEKAQLVSEVNIIRDLRNPFIIQYEDRIVHKPTTSLYIIMEYCPGGDLSALIKKCKKDKTHLDEAFIWKILAQCCLALKDCHRRTEKGVKKPVIHRDLKPGNILLDYEKNVKIADFGLAKELTSKSQLAQTNLGTPFYMAPEIINEKDYNEKADIWSLGCLVYELAALQPPFYASNSLSLAMKVNAGRFSRLPSRYSVDLFNVCASMLQVDPRKRPTVEDIEGMRGIGGAMLQAKQHLAFYDQSHKLTALRRELRHKEAKLAHKEADLAKRAEKLEQKALQLQEWERKLRARAAAEGAGEADDADAGKKKQEEVEAGLHRAHSLVTQQSVMQAVQRDVLAAKPRQPLSGGQGGLYSTNSFHKGALAQPPAMNGASRPAIHVYTEDTPAAADNQKIVPKSHTSQTSMPPNVFSLGTVLGAGKGLSAHCYTLDKENILKLPKGTSRRAHLGHTKLGDRAAHPGYNAARNPSPIRTPQKENYRSVASAAAGASAAVPSGEGCLREMIQRVTTR